MLADKRSSRGRSQGMHICQEVFHLLLSKDLAVSVHFSAAVADDFADAFVAGGEPADVQVRLFEDALKARSLFAAARVRLVAAIAITIVGAAAGGLLCI